jgi:hypothetical protein
MTPKEKAKDIYLKMLKWQTDADIYLKRNIISTAAIRCALIAVDEIINTIEYSSQADELSKVSYWTEVKEEMEEIEKL